MKYDFCALSLEEKIGQLFFASIDGQTLDEDARCFLADNHVGNIVLFSNSTQGRAQTAALCAALTEAITERCGVPPLISIDHEGGRVVRLREDVTMFPPAMGIGATDDTELASHIGQAMGEELRGMGIHINFAPALDVNTNADNPVIGLRSFGDDPQRVASFGIAMIRGMGAAGLMACGKHFPGHGDTAVDSHFGLPSVDKPVEALRAMELFPFRAVVEAGLEAVMTSHIVFPHVDASGVPATMSAAMLQGVLRGEMGFGGLIISDGMQMQAITNAFGIERGCIEALRAGCDLLCVGTGGAGTMAVQASCYRAVLEAARTGEIPMARIDDALWRIAAAKEKYCTPYVGNADWLPHEALARRAALASMTWMSAKRVPLGGRLLCAAMPIGEARFGVTEGNWKARSFAGIMSTALGAEHCVIEREMNLDVIDSADTVIVGVNRGDEEELRFVRKALQRGKATIVLLLGLPYVAARLAPGCAVLCTFGTTEQSLSAACEVLQGKAEAAGHVPVKI